MMTRRMFVALAAMAAIGLGLVVAHVWSNALLPQDEMPRAVNASFSRSDFDLVPIETRVLGQQNWLRGGPAALRVIVTDHQTGKPVDATVALTLQSVGGGTPSGRALTLYKGRTNESGTLDAGF